MTAVEIKSLFDGHAWEIDRVMEGGRFAKRNQEVSIRSGRHRHCQSVHVSPGLSDNTV